MKHRKLAYEARQREGKSLLKSQREEEAMEFIIAIRKVLRTQGISLRMLASKLDMPLLLLSDYLFFRKEIPDEVMNAMLVLFSLEFDGKHLTEQKSNSLKKNLFSKEKMTNDLEEKGDQNSASSFFLESNECFRVGNRIKEFRISRDSFLRNN